MVAVWCLAHNVKWLQKRNNWWATFRDNQSALLAERKIAAIYIFTSILAMYCLERVCTIPVRAHTPDIYKLVSFFNWIRSNKCIEVWVNIYIWMKRMCTSNKQSGLWNWVEIKRQREKERDGLGGVLWERRTRCRRTLMMTGDLLSFVSILPDNGNRDVEWCLLCLFR